MAGYAVGALALIILLSALNGFESTIFGGYTHGDADLKVVATKGKVFTIGKDTLEKLSKIKGVTSYFKCLEDKAIVKYNDQQTVALVRGVDEGILKTLNVDSLIIDGRKILLDPKSERNLAWLSEGLIYKLNIAQENAEIELMEPGQEAEAGCPGGAGPRKGGSHRQQARSSQGTLSGTSSTEGVVAWVG